MATKLEQTIFKESTYLSDEATSYVEDEATSYAEDEATSYAEDDPFEDMSPEEIFGAGMASSEDDPEDVTLGDLLRPFTEGDGSLGEMGEELAGLDEEVTGLLKDNKGVTKVTLEDLDLLPGSDISSKDLDDNEEEKETNYADDGDLSKFMEYISGQYPGNIPQHDGRSMVGCEKAISFLDKTNSEISRAIREDTENALDVQGLEDTRVKIMRDIMVLKEHLGKLKKKLKEEHGKKASLDENGIPNWVSASGEEVEYSDLKKEAATPRNIVIAVSPFERAISGIMINAHVSGGHSIEDVYGFLSNKYSIDEREELAIMQLCMDSGFHIFKDRGTYSPNDSSADNANGKTGVDFLRNYFA